MYVGEQVEIHWLCEVVHIIGEEPLGRLIAVTIIAVTIIVAAVCIDGSPATIIIITTALL